MAFRQKLKSIIFEYLGLAFGSAVMALGLVLFLIPNKIAPGGVSGLAIVLYYLFRLPVGMMMLVFNIPLFLLGVKILGKQFGPRTLFSFVLVSIITDVCDKALHLPALTTEPLLSSIFGGVVLGLGLGIVFRFKGTTGGSDIVGQIITKYSNISIGVGIMIVDFFVITFAGFAFQNVNLALYGFISLYFSSKIVDLVLDGFDYARSFYIISEKQDEIIEAITQDMNRGGTTILGAGFWTRKERNILFTVVTRKEVATIRQIVKRIDPKAFIIITNVHEVVGEGFRQRV